MSCGANVAGMRKWRIFSAFILLQRSLRKTYAFGLIPVALSRSGAARMRDHDEDPHRSPATKPPPPPGPRRGGRGRAKRLEDYTASARRILSIVQASPGISTAALRRRAGVGWGVYYWAIKQLKSGKHVVAQRQGRYTLVFPLDTLSRKKDAPTRALVWHPTARRIGRAVIARPGRRVPELAEDLGLSNGAVYYHARRMRKAGLLGPSQLLRPTPALIELLKDLAD